MKDLSASQIALNNLREQADKSKHHRKEATTLNDLFRKYNIWTL